MKPKQLRSRECVCNAGLKLDSLDEDGFVIQTVGPRDLVLAGRRPQGTAFAVLSLPSIIRRHAVVFPMKLDEVAPQRARFGIGRGSDRETPSFLLRRWSFTASFDDGERERHNSVHSRFEFHHHLLRVFRLSTYYDARPEWFSETNGKRVCSKDDSNHH